MEDVGKDVPLPHVEWIAYYLNQLSPQSQLQAAFGGGRLFSPGSYRFCVCTAAQDPRTWHDSRGRPGKNNRSNDEGVEAIRQVVNPALIGHSAARPTVACVDPFERRVQLTGMSDPRRSRRIASQEL